MKPTKEMILAATSKAALSALTRDNDAESVDCVDCTRRTKCVGCVSCTDCDRSNACVSCRNVDRSNRCRNSSNLNNCADCVACHADDGTKSAKLLGCSDCVNCDRCMFVVGGRNLKNRFMDIELTPEEFDLLWALPDEAA